MATIPFHWVNQPASERDRRINDLGWEVTDYTADRDLGAGKPAVPPPQQPATSPKQPASPMALVVDPDRRQHEILDGL